MMTDDRFLDVRKRQCRFLYCGYKSYGIICHWILQIKTNENNLKKLEERAHVFFKQTALVVFNLTLFTLQDTASHFDTNTLGFVFLICHPVR